MGWKLDASIICSLAALAMVPSLVQATTAYSGGTDLGRASATETTNFDVWLPSRDPAGLERLLAAQQNPASPQYHRWLSPKQYADQFGPDPDAASRVAADLAAAGFKATTGTSGIHAEGRVSAAERLFGIEIHDVASAEGAIRQTAVAKVTLPASWRSTGAHVVAFDSRLRHHALARYASHDPQNRDSTVGSYWFDDLKQAYKAPSYQNLTGTGRTIAILMDADVHDSDIQDYFDHEYLAAAPVNRVRVNGGAGFSTTGDSFEATLDIQQASGMAPGAAIILYIIPDLSDQSIMAGLNQILSDNLADIVSMSIGGCERTYLRGYNNGVSYASTLDQYHGIFEQGNALGVTFVASSGDGGGLQCPTPGYFNSGSPPFTFQIGISSPADDPAVTAVGGTNLMTYYSPPSLDSTYDYENAKADALTPYDPYSEGSNVSGGYFGSGGGASMHFSAPSWQSLVSSDTDMRSTPDVSLQIGGCPDGAVMPCKYNRSAVYVYFNGGLQSAVGTSVSAPGFAGVVALMEQNQGGKRAGNVNQMIYQLAQAQAEGGLRYFHQTIPGFNGLYYSYDDGSAPYNMVVGNGTLNIHHFIGAASLPVAGVPQTPSNP